MEIGGEARNEKSVLLKEAYFFGCIFPKCFMIVKYARMKISV
jgi:hypothetical protein